MEKLGRKYAHIDVVILYRKIWKKLNEYLKNIWGWGW